MKDYVLKGMLIPLLAVLAFCCVPMSAAKAEVGINPPPDIPAYTLPAEGAVLSATDFRAQIATSIREAARESTELNRFEKRRVERVMSGRGFFGEWRKQAVIDKVAKKMVDDGEVEVTPDGVMAAGNWQQWMEIIQQLLPLILQIISIFGG